MRKIIPTASKNMQEKNPGKLRHNTLFNYYLEKFKMDVAFPGLFHSIETYIKINVTNEGDPT